MSGRWWRPSRPQHQALSVCAPQQLVLHKSSPPSLRIPPPKGAILLECTELPGGGWPWPPSRPILAALLFEYEITGYSNALRQKFNLPVYDVLTLCSLLIASVAVSPTLGAHAHFVNEM